MGIRRSLLVIMPMVALMLGQAGTASARAPAVSAQRAQSAAVPTIVRVVELSETNSASPKAAIATCPSGTNVVGTGARILGGQGQVVIDDLIPNAALTTVTVTGYEDQDGFSGDWTVTAIAFCTAPPPNLERVVLTRGPESEPHKTIVGECPGTSVLGVGAEIAGGQGQVTMEALIFTPMVTAIEDQDGNPFDWWLTLYVICGSPSSFGRHIVTTTTDFTSRSKSVTTSCASDERVMATGFSLVQGRGQVVISQLFSAAATPTDVYVSAQEDQDGQSMVWSLKAWAMCAGT